MISILRRFFISLAGTENCCISDSFLGISGELDENGYECLGVCEGSTLIDDCGYCGGPEEGLECVCDAESTCSLQCSGETSCIGTCGEVSDDICLAQDNSNLLSSGAYHSFGIQYDGTVVGWGRNDEGQSTVPDDLTDVIEVAGGRDHTLAVNQNGTVKAW